MRIKIDPDQYMIYNQAWMQRGDLPLFQSIIFSNISIKTCHTYHAREYVRSNVKSIDARSNFYRID